MTIFVFESPPAVFIRVRKTGSTSIVRGLFGGPDKASEISEGVFRQGWSSLFVFSFVRNPFERMVSCFKMFKGYKVSNADEARQRSELTLSRLMDIIEDDSIRFANVGTYMDKLKQHALPMTHPSYHIDKAGFVGRFETYDKDFRELTGKLGLNVKEIPHHRNQKRATDWDYRPFFDADNRKRAERILQKDLDTFRYIF